MMRPNLFVLVAANKRPLQLAKTQIDIMVPRGSVFRLDYILVAYNRTVEEGVQTSPELDFDLFDSRGLALNNVPVRFGSITTPAGGKNVSASWSWGMEYPPGAVITMSVSGMDAGPVPGNISVTYLGQKGVSKR